jgi:hypothetical protein
MLRIDEAGNQYSRSKRAVVALPANSAHDRRMRSLALAFGSISTLDGDAGTDLVLLSI